MRLRAWKKHGMGVGGLLVLVTTVLLAPGWGSAVAAQGSNVSVSNEEAHPLAAREHGGRSGSPGAWTVVGVGGTERPVGVIGVVRDKGLLHVAWVRRTGGNAYDLVHTLISPSGAVGPPSSVVTGWAGLGDAALANEGAALLAFFPGERTTNTTEPYFGLNLAQSSDGGASWSLAGTGSYSTREYAYGRTPSVAVPDNSGRGAIVTWNGTSDMVVRRGAGDDFNHYGPKVCCNLDQNIATDGRGHVWVAWCSQNDAPAGRWVQELRPEDGSPIGSAAKLPGSESPLCESAGREPLVFRAGGGFYAADAAGASGTKVVLWRIGSAGPSTVTSSSDTHSRVALAAAPDGRLWVAWRTFHGAAAIHLRRSNRSATRFGAEVTVKPPKDAVEASHIDLNAQARRVDVLASFSFVDSSRNTLFHTQALPGLTLSARGGKVVRFVVTDAGDPVSGATIKVGGTTLHTNASGRASIQLKRGTYKGVATKAGYVGAAAKVVSS